MSVLYSLGVIQVCVEVVGDLLAGGGIAGVEAPAMADGWDARAKPGGQVKAGQGALLRQGQFRPHRFPPMRNVRASADLADGVATSVSKADPAVVAAAAVPVLEAPVAAAAVGAP